MRSKALTRALTIGLGVLALSAMWVIFELRYVWYVQLEQLLVLRFGIGLVAGLIALFWALYPSRVAVALLGLAGLFFPLIIYPQYVGSTAGFVPWDAVVLALLLGTTQLRRTQLIN